MKDVQLPPFKCLPRQLASCLCSSSLAWPGCCLSNVLTATHTHAHTQTGGYFICMWAVGQRLFESRIDVPSSFILYKFKFFYLNSNLVLKRLIAVDSTVLSVSLSPSFSLLLSLFSRHIIPTLTDEFYDCLAYRRFSSAFLSIPFTLPELSIKISFAVAAYFCFFSCFVFLFLFFFWFQLRWNPLESSEATQRTTNRFYSVLFSSISHAAHLLL